MTQWSNIIQRWMIAISLLGNYVLQSSAPQFIALFSVCRDGEEKKKKAEGESK